MPTAMVLIRGRGRLPTRPIGPAGMDVRPASSPGVAPRDGVKEAPCDPAAPSAAEARMARAVREDSGAVMPVCAWVDGEYGVSGVYLGVEAEIGREGVRRVVEGDLSDSEKAGLREAAEAVRAKQADVADL